MTRVFNPLEQGVRFARILGQFGLRGTAFKLAARLRRRLWPVEVDSYVDGRTLELIRTRPTLAVPELNLPVFETAAEQAQIQPGSTVSVVIPTLNAGAEFAVLLAALQAQRGCERLELIVVDSGSTDQTVALAQAYGATVRALSAAEFSHSHARNLGAQAATGAYLLFMVQDALPASPLWVAELVAALQRYQAVAVSCVEAPRADADLLACVLNQAHYRFLEADEDDRVLSWPVSAEYRAVRRNSQLCNVACLIERQTFLRYGLRGAYAEDLDLGMRLARDGHRLALLNSVKVVHSHNRPADYHLKRGYVDSLALAGLFADYPAPPALAVSELGQQSLAVYQVLTHLFAQAQASRPLPCPLNELAEWLSGNLLALYDNPAVALAQPVSAGADAYTAFLVKLAGAIPAQCSLRESAFAGLLRQALLHTLEYLKGIHETVDAELFESLRECLRKTHALQLGKFLASSLAASQAGVADAEWIDRELRKGV